MIIIKFLGMIFIIISSGLFGYYNSKKEDYRINDLEEFKKAIALLKSEIEYSINPLPEAMFNISQKTTKHFSEFFKYISDKLYEHNGESIEEIWISSFKICLQKTYLSEEDNICFISLGNSLGYLDRSVQINSMNIVIDYIDNKVEYLLKLSEKNKKMYGSLGILGGILIIILLI